MAGEGAEAIEEFCKELGRRVQFIRDLYRTGRIGLRRGEGLSLALDEAAALAAGDKSSEPFSQELLIRVVNDAHIIYAIAESLETCTKAGLNIAHHLKQLTTGTADYGTPAASNVGTMFLKDFEFEIFIAATLIRHGLMPALPDEPNDPRGDVLFDGIFIEAKHPNSIGQLEKLLRKFNAALRNDRRFGVFAVGLEDAYNLGDRSEFLSQADYQDWLGAKQQGMEAMGLNLVRRAASLPRIAALVQTQSKVEIVGGGTTMRRVGNSVLFDHRSNFSDYEMTARAIAEAFNPRPILYSTLNV